jgi:hypothetical protein
MKVRIHPQSAADIPAARISRHSGGSPLYRRSEKTHE